MLNCIIQHGENVIRKAWCLPFTTQCRFIHTINNYLPIDVQLEENNV